MDNWINPADVSAFNSAVRSVESYGAAKRGAIGVLERTIAAKDQVGLEDHEIFAAMARVSPQRSGLRWLCRLLATLTEYLGSWGALLLISFALVNAVKTLVENAGAGFTALRKWVVNNPFAAGGTLLGAAGVAGLLLKRDDEMMYDDTPLAKTLQSAISSVIPLPISAAIMTINAASGKESADPITREGGGEAALANEPGYTPPSNGGSANFIQGRRDAYDAFDSFDARDARDESWESGSIGS